MAEEPLTFHEVVDYVRGLKGRSVRIEARAPSQSETGVFLVGNLVELFHAPSPASPDLARYSVTIGADGSGFLLSARDFDSAWVDLYDPETAALVISMRSDSPPTDFRIVIPDERLRAGHPLPT